MAQQHGAGGQYLRAHGQGQPCESGTPHACCIAAPQRMPHPHGRGLGNPERQHEAQGGHIQCYLMRRRRHFAQAANQQRRHGKQAAFHGDRHANRQTGANQRTQTRAIWPVPVGEQLQIGKAFADGQIQRKSQCLCPKHHAGGNPDPGHAQFGEPQQAIGQHIRQRRQHTQPAKAQQHGGQRPMQAVAEIAHAQVQGEGRHAPAQRMQKRSDARHDVRCDAHRCQQQRHRADQAKQQRTQCQCQPQRLPKQWTNLAAAACAIQLRDCRWQCHQGAHRCQHRQPKQGGAHRHRRQCGGAVMAGHHRIDQTHQPTGQVACGQWRSQRGGAPHVVTEA